MPISVALSTLPVLPIFTLFDSQLCGYYSRLSGTEVALLARWSITKKLFLCVALIALIVCTLSISGMMSVYAYRDVVKTISFRAKELPLAQKITVSIDNLFATVQEPKQGFNSVAKLEAFRISMGEVGQALRNYRSHLQQIEPGTGISDNREELAAVHRIEHSLSDVYTRFQEDWAFDTDNFSNIRPELVVLQSLAAELPDHLQIKMEKLGDNVRGKYHTLIAITSMASILSVALLIGLVKFFYDGALRPLQTVIRGSRRVASGDFEFRVELKTHDEMAELAAALNAMTSRFKEIRDDLDRQVRERTKEVVRSEQLASVGFLAAGVAHEINNPLQAIAMCAESLESRVQDIIASDDALPDENHNQEITVLRKYLRRIQDEAFRCKGITEKLLNYSRLGDAEKQDTDITAVLKDVIELVRTLGTYRGKRIEFKSTNSLFAKVVPHEIKQIALNLITNALDSLDHDGVVDVELSRTGRNLELVVRDNGCGMSEEVKKHLFEPFFTRRRDGQGTGLGLSITYRIVQDHGGTISASSDGPGRGSSFRITLPMNHHEERHEKLQAA